MKTINSIVLIIILGLISCRKDGTWGIKGEGDNITEIRDIDGFTGIRSCTDADITYTNDSVYRVEISAQKNILSVLETKVEGSDLYIGFKRNVWKHNKVMITIHSPNLDKLQISGSGDIHSLSSIHTNNLELSISGSGNITMLGIYATGLTARISGSGDIQVNEGNVQSEYFSISGSGSIKTEFVKATRSEANISGSGNILLTASDQLNVTISGNGDVKYHGQPGVNANISGSGKVIRLH